MRPGAKPKKIWAAAKRAGTGKSRKDAASRVRDLETRLAEALEREAEARKRETDALRREAEARDQQTATSEILRVISSSPGDIQPVFDAIAANAARLCDAVNGLVIRFDGELLHLAAHYNVDPERLAAVREAYPRPPSRGALSGRAILTGDVVHVPDVTEDAEYTLPAATTIGYRSVLAVPMMHEGVARGTILVARDVVAPFSEAHIALIQTFADQAVIAIENARLFKELEGRNRDLAEALDQQTATAEILRVISSSPTDLQPVFKAILLNANQLCDASFSLLWLWDGETVRAVAHENVSPQFAEDLRTARPGPNPRTPLGLTLTERMVVHVPDVLADPRFIPADVPSYRREGARSILSVPMLREGDLMGVINAWRREPRAFTGSQIELLKTFANQAVIAIENVRLFNETKEALQQQTATSEILRVISSSPTDVQPVFDAIVRSAARLCNGFGAAVFRVEDGMIHHPANFGGAPEALAELRARYPRPIGMDTAPGQAIVARAPVQFADVEDSSVIGPVREAGRVLGFRSCVAVPMLSGDDAVGAIVVIRRTPGLFSDAEVELLRTFSDQAVIAIENVRLFKELEARTAALTRSVEQLTALGEVGRAVSSTLDLETVLTTIVSRAVQLSGLDGGVVFEYDEGAEEFVHRAATEGGGGLAEARRATRIRRGEGVVGRTAITLEPAQVPDITVPGVYESRLRDNLIESGIRAVLAVPMVRDDRLTGCLVVSRNRSGDFPAETIELLRTFATQSAIAIQNARLFREIADKSRQLEAASRHKSEFLANMSHELRTPLNAIIGFSEVLTERMFGELNAKQDEYLKDIYASGQHLLSLINDILDLSKIEAGRMELELKDFDLPQAIGNAVTLVRERAGRRGIALHQAVDRHLGQIRGDERKIKQVLLNLLSNALKFTSEGGRVGVRATISDGMAEVAVTDTGVGIAPEDQEAVFEEFRQVGTADKKVEGTGLGLALSRKFIELHGGRIWVESRVGQGSTFTFALPLRRDD